jgi:RNA-directed DNA polymerase
VTVNGPEDGLEWAAIDWRAHEQNVRRLRQRIFKAAREQDWPKVRSLQRLMLRSRSNTLVSVRQVTQRNAGRKTAGIDGEVALTPEARASVAVRVHQSRSSWNPRAVRRVYKTGHFSSSTTDNDAPQLPARPYRTRSSGRSDSK